MGRQKSADGIVGLLSCPVIGCHINIVDLLITGEYYAAEVDNSL